MADPKIPTFIPPAIPVIPSVPPRDATPNPVFAKCGACGILLRETMGYSCTRTDCPVFPQTSCGVGRG